MNEATPRTAQSSRRKVAIGAAVAVAIAAAGAVFFVLSSEFGIDPTGFGKAAGLTGLAPTSGEQENIYLKRGQARTNVLFPLDASAAPDETALRRTLAEKGIALSSATPIRSDRFEIELPPYEGIELKYDLAKGAPMIFTWKASAPVYLDMHSHPFDGGTALTESFVIDQLPSQTAVYVAPFSGIHGWYWQNRTLKNVTLTLDATGQFTASRIFDQAGEHPRPLSGERTPANGPSSPPE
jgi:hypothetical protein